MTENPEKITPAKKAFYAFLSVLAIVLLLVGWMLIARVRPYLSRVLSPCGNAFC